MSADNTEFFPSTSRSLGPLRRLWPFMRPHRKLIMAAGLALSVAAATVLGLGPGLKFLIDKGFVAKNPALLNWALGFMMVIVVALAASSYTRFSLVSWVGERVVADLRKAVFNHVVGLSPVFFETTPTAEVLSRLTNDTTLLQSVVGSSVPIALRNGLIFIGGTIMLWIASPYLTTLAFLVVPFVLVPIMALGYRVRRLSRSSQERLAGVSAAIDETLFGLRTVQAFTQEEAERQRFSSQVEGAFGVSVKRIRVRALLTALVMLLVFGAVALVLWFGGREVLAGRMTEGGLSSFLFYAILMASAVGSLADVYGDLQRAAGAAERLFDLLMISSDVKAPTHPVALPVASGGAVAFDKVRFCYPARPDTPALDDVSFQIKAGETVAIVGPSGAGKTTIFQLLLRFYDPQRGQISLDGIDIRQVDLKALRDRIGIVPQDPVIFSANAWENIRYGRSSASDEEVRTAAQAAHAAEFLDRLPEGFNTFLGEKGIRLSGGQRQRIAIARAILKNPPLMLLDEATSALDAESERAVQQALEQLMQNRTTLVIAHRLATVRQADRILVLDKGRLAASGTHEELIGQGGLYARLAALQFGLEEQT